MADASEFGAGPPVDRGLIDFHLFSFLSVDVLFVPAEVMEMERCLTRLQCTFITAAQRRRFQSLTPLLYSLRVIYSNCGPLPPVEPS